MKIEKLNSNIQTFPFMSFTFGKIEEKQEL